MYKPFLAPTKKRGKQAQIAHPPGRIRGSQRATPATECASPGWLGNACSLAPPTPPESDTWE